MEKNYVIAIDGCAATGKTTLAKLVSEKLNILYIDTGAMYRAAGIYFLDNNLPFEEDSVNKHIDEVNIEIKYIDSSMKIYLNGEDVTQKIRENRASMAASDISKFKVVRERLVAMQRDIANSQNVVLEGRDIGTVVFPNADLKIFLTTSIDERTRRRSSDLLAKGENIPIDTIKSELEKRDIQDSTRKESPLRQADDAILIDTTALNKEETANLVIKLLNERIETKC